MTMNLRFPETKKLASIELAKLHKHKVLTVSIRNETEIAFASSQQDAVAMPLYTEELSQFFQMYNGKLIFMDAFNSIYFLVNVLNLSSELFNSFDDVGFLMKLSAKQADGFEHSDMLFKPLSKVLSNALHLWYLIPKYLEPAVANGNIKLYTDIFQPAIMPRLKMKIVSLEPDEKLQKKIESDIDDLVTYISRHPVIKKNRKGFHPFNKQDIEWLKKALGHPSKTDLGDLLWCGKGEEIVHAAYEANRLNALKPLSAPVGYKFKGVDIEIFSKNQESKNRFEGMMSLREIEICKKLIMNKKLTPVRVMEDKVIFLERSNSTYPDDDPF